MSLVDRILMMSPGLRVRLVLISVSRIVLQSKLVRGPVAGPEVQAKGPVVDKTSRRKADIDRN